MRQTLFICLLLAGITLGIYRSVGHLDFIAYDDPDYILANQHVLGGITSDNIWWAFTSAHACNWHPVTWLSHMLDCQLFGLNPGVFHLENLAIHVANSLLLFLVLRKMTKTTWRSALVAALFAWHPAHIQSVAWISERKDMLSGFFMMLTLWTYASYVEEVKTQGPKAKIFFQACLAAFALGLMSKPMLVTLPAILLLLDFWPLQRITGPGVRSAEWKPLLREKVSLMALSLASVVATLWAQNAGRAIIQTVSLPVSVRLANAPVFVGTYLGKLFWPVNLASFYPYRIIPFWEQAGALLLLALLTFIWLWRMRSAPWFLAGWLWFLIMLLPVIGIVQVGAQSIADRYTYLPSIGIFIIVAWGLGEIAAISRGCRAVITMAAIALLLGCLLDTRVQLRYWRDSITLFRHALEVTKENNASTYFGLGYALWHEGDLDGAVTNFMVSLEMKTAYPWQSHAMGTETDLGTVLLEEDRPVEAEPHFRVALQIDPKNAFIHKYLGDALTDQDKNNEAESEYATASSLAPGDNVLLEEINDSKALAVVLADLKTAPTTENYLKTGDLEAHFGKFRDAIMHYRAAAEATPDSPNILNNLAWMLATCPDQKARNGTEAVTIAEHACELTDWQQTIYIGTLAAAYAAAEKWDDAIATAQKACDSATKNGETDLLQKNEKYLELYRAHRPAGG